ncbi:MAG: hypothetical protein U0T82_14660 [Bacteroidales bacterium]
MRTRLLALFILALLPLIPAFSQRGIINNGALIVVNNNGVINIQGGSAASYVSQTSGSFHGRMDLNGKLYLDGNWLNNTTGGNGLINPGSDGEVILDGTTLQTIGGTQTSWFEKLTLNNTAGASLLGSVNLYGNLGLTTGKLALGSYPMLLSLNSSVVGTPSATAMVVADGTGELRKNYSATGSFLFPVGDNTTTAEYSPVTLNFTTGTFGSGAWAGVRLVNAKHPGNTSGSSFLNRYWITSQNNITSFTCSPSFVYTDGDINGTESSIYGGMYVSPFWTLLNAATTGTNTLSGNVSTVGEFTGGQSSAFSVSFTMTSDGLITEGAENGENITVSLFNAEFEASLNSSNWSLTNAPQGISIGSVTRLNNTQATVTLAGNRTKDYDANISNLNLTIGHQELKNLDAGSVSASTGVVFTSVNDAESISMADDGNITEGAIAGEKIFVTLTGGTFAASLNTSNWVLTNVPPGISIGSVTRTSATTAEITLAGTASDYDSDITNTDLSISEVEIDDHTGANLTTNTGVRFVAIVEPLVTTMANDGNGISEGSENGEVITVTITNRTFAASLSTANWTLSNLPAGVTKGTLTRVDDTHATIALSGSRTVDYDANLIPTLQIAVGEIVNYASVVTLNSGVTLTANNDAESLSISGTIAEGAENGAAITVTLTGGTYASSLTKANWTISNLPAGVTIGSVTRTSGTVATITLSGNRTIDFDSDITLSLSVHEAEVDDYTGSNLVPSTGTAKITANADNEVLSISDNGISEGAENGEIITANLAGGTIVGTINPANWTLSNLPAGVTKGTVTRISSTQVQITLSGNRTTDYDNNITNLTLTVNEAEIDDNTIGVSAATGVTFVANNDAESLTMADDGNITEGAIAGEKIFVTLAGGTFAASLNSANWALTNMPSGISIGSITRTSGTTAEITLTGTATDYDSDITNATLSVNEAEIDDYTGVNLTTNTGVRFIAIDEALTIGMANDGNGISEGSENGEIITVTISSKTFAATITPSNWSLSNLPQGVTRGTVTRVDATHVTIALSGNRSTDYDTDIVPTLQIAVGEIVGQGTIVTIPSGVTITANNDAESLTISSAGINEGAENGSTITVTLSGGTYASSLTKSNWIISNLPSGVTIGSVTRTSATVATIGLMGTRTNDFDTDITLNLSVNEAEIDDYTGASLAPSSGTVKITANADNEVLSISDNGITEGAENGRIITVNLSGGTIVGTINPANWTLSNLPAGVTKGTVTRINAVPRVQITLSGNRTTDYDNNITNLTTYLINEAEIDDNTIGVSAATGVTFVANNDAESLTMADDGNITEGAIAGEKIFVTLAGGTFAASLNSANWALTNMPSGISIGSITRTSGTTAEITLTGTATDYDSDITNATLSVNEAGGDDYTEFNLTTNTGVRFIAIDEALTIGMANDGNGISEGSENGEIITVTISSKTFAATITPSNWSLSNLPQGHNQGNCNQG